MNNKTTSNAHTNYMNWYEDLSTEEQHHALSELLKEIIELRNSYVKHLEGVIEEKKDVIKQLKSLEQVITNATGTNN